MQDGRLQHLGPKLVVECALRTPCPGICPPEEQLINNNVDIHDDMYPIFLNAMGAYSKSYIDICQSLYLGTMEDLTHIYYKSHSMW